MSDEKQNSNDGQETNNTASSREELLIQIGKKLHHARKRRGESIDEPSRLLKLSHSNLKALEAGDWESLPDKTYALGFLRQYSHFLELDLNHEIELLKSDKYQLTKPQTFPDPPVAPSRKWAWIAAAAFAFLFILFNIINQSNDTVEITNDTSFPSEMLEPVEQSSENEQAVIPAAEQVADTSKAEPAKAKLIEKVVKPAPVTKKAVAVAKPASKTAAAKAAATAKAVANKTVQKPVTKSPEGAKNSHHYRFEASDDDIWLQIFEPDETGLARGKMIKEVLLKPGYHANIRTAATSLWINCGNAPALRIKVDDKVVVEKGSFGGGKVVIKDYHFTIPQE